MLGLLLTALLATPSRGALTDRSFRRYYNLTIQNTAPSQSFKVESLMRCASVCLSGGGNCGYYWTNGSHCSIFPAITTPITKGGGTLPMYFSKTLYADHGYQPYDHGRNVRVFATSPTVTYRQCLTNCASPFEFGTPFVLRSAEDADRLKLMLAPDQALFIGLNCLSSWIGTCINYLWADGTEYNGTYKATLNDNGAYVNGAYNYAYMAALAEVIISNNSSKLQLSLYPVANEENKGTNVGCLCQAEEFYP